MKQLALATLSPAVALAARGLRARVGDRELPTLEGAKAAPGATAGGAVTR